MNESDLIALYITFPDKKGRLTVNGADRKAIIDLPEEALSQIKDIVMKTIAQSNSGKNGNKGNLDNNGNTNQ